MNSIFQYFILKSTFSNLKFKFYLKGTKACDVENLEEVYKNQCLPVKLLNIYFENR